MLPGLSGIAGINATKTTSVSYQAFQGDGAPKSSYTFSSQPFGAASSGRVVVVAIGSKIGSGSHTISSVTIGGVSASILVQRSSSDLTGGIVAAVVPTGTTGDVVVNLSTAVAQCGVAIWSSTGLPGAVATDTDSNTDLSALTLNVDPGGFVIAACVNVDGQTATWSGATEVVDDIFDEGEYLSAASEIIPLSSVTVQPTLSGAASPTVFVAATF
jgi:hypothetical protein